MRIYSLSFGCLLAFACFISITWIKSIPSDGVLGMEMNPQILYKRLLVAEELGLQVSRNLSSIMEQLRNMTTAASTTETVRQLTGGSGQQMLLQPNIYFYLPHLRQHPESLLPNVVLGQGRRGVSMVFGIPTVKREKQSYLVNTLSYLFYSLTSFQRQDLLVIVFVAETDSNYVGSIAETINKTFPKEVQSGLLEVISPSQYYYPNLSSIRLTFGDSRERVKWRTKQSLDFSFLMLYAQDKGTYYVQLEDDVVAKSGYYETMKTFVTQMASKEWLYLEFSQLGFIGKMFQTRDLPMIIHFFLMFHKDKPIDWLLDHILWVKVCNPEKDLKHCDRQKGLLRHRYKPSLFQHVGLHSSLPGKIQNLKDKDFGKQTLYQAHNNPAAKLSSSLIHYQQHSLDRAYKGEDFFWALMPLKEDFILFNFTQPINISRYLFRSGNIDASGDKLYNTSVEVLPSNVITRDKLDTNSSAHHQQSDNGFIIIGAFEDGVAEGTIGEALQPISALRLVVHSNSDVWALISEIFIQV